MIRGRWKNGRSIAGNFEQVPERRAIIYDVFYFRRGAVSGDRVGEKGGACGITCSANFTGAASSPFLFCYGTPKGSPSEKNKPCRPQPAWPRPIASCTKGIQIGALSFSLCYSNTVTFSILVRKRRCSGILAVLMMMSPGFTRPSFLRMSVTSCMVSSVVVKRS